MLLPHHTHMKIMEMKMTTDPSHNWEIRKQRNEGKRSNSIGKLNKEMENKEKG